MPIKKGDLLKGQVRLSCWARATLDLVKVRYKMDGYTIYTADRPDYWECLWNAGSVKPGRHKLTLEVLRPERQSRGLPDGDGHDGAVRKGVQGLEVLRCREMRLSPESLYNLLAEPNVLS